MFEHHKKESPILSLAGIGGGPSSYIFYSASGGGGDDTPQEISRSLRFAADAGSSPYLAKSFSSAGTQTTWTHSCWFKLVAPDTNFQVTPLFSGSSPWGGISIYQKKIRFAAYSGSAYVVNLHTTQLLRDPNAWYHLVTVFDSTNGTNSEKARLYLNGKRITDFGTATYPSDSATTTINSTTEQRIGHEVSNNVYSNCYLADINFLDGTAVTDTNGTVDQFGFFDSYGVWQPKVYSGSYGSNGYHLTFSDASSSSSLGTDTSGSSNNFSVSGISVSAGVDNDSLFDSPSNFESDSGDIIGNYCTLNPNDKTTVALTNGNLKAAVDSNSCVKGTFFPESGKWYFEYKITTLGNPYGGICSSSLNTNYLSAISVAANNTGTIYHRTRGTTVYPGKTVRHNTNGATHMVALDLDNNRIWWGKGGQWYRFDASDADQTTTKSNIESGLGGYGFDDEGQGWSVILGTSSNASSYEFNAGQRPFLYASDIPSGFKSLCTQNLSSSPSVSAGSTCFDISTYSGDSTDNRVISVGMDPDVVWFKQRTRGGTASSGQDSPIVDIVRGVNQNLYTNQNYVEGTNPYGSVSNFGTGSFTIKKGSDSTNGFNQVNATSSTYVAWSWDAGATTSTIAAGTSLNSVTYNQDRKWSDGVANSNSDFDQAKTNAFNGSRANKLRTGGNSVKVTINFNPALTVNDYVELWGEDYSTADFEYTATIDGVTHTRDVDEGKPCRFTMGGSLTQVTVDNNSGSGRTYLEYIKVDGRELVDNDQTPPDATTVSANVRANPAAGFSIIQASTDSTNTMRTVGHGLSKEPEFIITKSTQQADIWFTYHKDNQKRYREYLRLNDVTGQQSTTSLLWQHTKSTMGFNGAAWVPSGQTHEIIFYAWHGVEGYSRFGTYLGNNNDNGPVIETGFRPRWLLIKRIIGGDKQWVINDTERDPYNVSDSVLVVSNNSEEWSNSENNIDILSNGFKLRDDHDSKNGTSSTYVYAAFAEHPLRSARAR